MSPYQPSQQVKQQIEQSFVYHPVMPGQQERYVAIRTAGKNLAELITTKCPPSRELSLALTKIEEAMFWANASIARHE